MTFDRTPRDVATVRPDTTNYVPNRHVVSALKNTNVSVCLFIIVIIFSFITNYMWLTTSVTSVMFYIASLRRRTLCVQY